MATARALSIPEILLDIAEQLHTDSDLDRRSLARLARVSLVFREPALRVLWGDMPSIEPLFKLLPNCVPVPASTQADAGGDGGEASQSSYSLTLDGSISDDDIARLREFACRIRVLDFPSKTAYPSWIQETTRIPRPGITLDPHSLELLLLRTGLPLLPSLAKLKLPVTPPYLSDPTFLLCPSLRQLTISFPERHLTALNEGVRSLFDGIRAQCPHLTHLRVQSECYTRHDPEDVDFKPWMRRDMDWMLPQAQAQAQVVESMTASQVFCDALAGLARLEDLEVFKMITMHSGVAGRDLISALAALPRLTDCSFALYIPAHMLRTIRPGFTSLRVLAVSNIVLGTELGLFNSPDLCDLTIYHTDWIKADVYGRTLAVVTHRFPHLHRLVWKFGLQKMPLPTVERNIAPALQPLSVLERLRKLTIDVANRPICDDDIAVLVGALPLLVHLELKSDVESTGPSAQSLLALARGCSSLHTLRLSSLFLTEADEAHAQSYPFVGNHLRYLRIDELRCGAVMHGAMIIDLLFPFLDIEECRRRTPKIRRSRSQFIPVLKRLGEYHAARK